MTEADIILEEINKRFDSIELMLEAINNKL